MKVTLFLSSLWLFIASFFAPENATILTGTVTDSKEALIGATVKVMRGTEFVRASITDYNGDYRIQLDPGIYDLEFSYQGFQVLRIYNVQILEGRITTQNATLLPALGIDEVVTTKVGASSVDGGAVDIKGARSNGTDTYIDGIRVSGGVPPVQDLKQLKVITKDFGGERNPAPAKRSEKAAGMAKSPEGALSKAKSTRPTATPADDIITVEGRKKRAVVVFEPETYEEKVILIDADGEGMATEFKEEASIETGTPAQPAPRAGLLTAGEWNDLHNWNRHWVDLQADGEIDAHQKMYGFFPRQRYTVMLTNENDFPIADAVAQLKADGKMIWEARTDNTGKAELWAALFSPEKETAKLRAEIWVDGKKYEINKLKPAVEGFNNLKAVAECNASKNVDIMWAVDATGSMGDEIEYLKTELLDVIGRAKSRNPELVYRMGTVFYRDHGDEYLTRSSPLSSDMLKTVEFIQNQFAGGGGDYPEAVHSALEEAIFKQKWNENAVARICFLVLDASPHQTPDVIASLHKSIQEAARLGIRIVPIAASGVQKDTEFLMKFFGLATNGSYVFLTDHSGIGGKHMEPTTDEYKVEPLNNLLVRLITEFTSIQTCEGKSEIRFEGDPQQQPGPALQALYYPNPAVDQFTLELPFEVQSVTIYNSEGQAVRKLEKPVTGQNVIQINDLAAGFYTIRILNNGLMQSGKLMVVRS